METSPSSLPQPTVTVYATGICPYCIRAEKLLRSVGFTEINKIRVDLDVDQRKTMIERTGRKTVPQIYIGEQHIGGYDDLYALDQKGGLKPLLIKV